MEKPVSRQIMEKAFEILDSHLTAPLTLILGGGGCMILAYDYPLATTDVDALPLQRSFEEIDPIVKLIAEQLMLPGDWMNPYFSSFTYVLPSDFRTRLKTVFSGKQLKVDALGKEDMLILKCFAHRPKDLGHARALIRAGADLKLVEHVLESCEERGVPKAREAIEFFDGLVEELDS